ncbi:hypothetical protein C8R44DRAFT_749377 [Mycena epipterygia]|nr:hypothetical protein C8R44DRAFT_749377 [Mycena epipterygia]
MAFYGQFPPAAGPSHAPMPQLSPEQYAMAVQHFQYQMQIPIITPPRPPHLPLPSPVIDPSLQSPDELSTEQRIQALEREINDLKRSNSTSNTDASTSKRRKGAKPSPYLLKNPKNLSSKQTDVRRLLMRKIKSELRQLTGNSNNDESASNSDDSDAPAPRTSRTDLAFDFTANVDHPTNVKILERAVTLVWTEQHDPKSDTFSLPHADVKFTRDDLTEFGKTNFRSWKKNWKAENDPELARKQARTESKGRQDMRRKELKENRLKAIPEYKKKNKRDPVFVLETDWMSDELSGPDTDDEDKKKAHRHRLIQTLHLAPEHQDEAIWERVRPGFQSIEFIQIKDDLDAIIKAKNKACKKRVRARVRRVDLGNTHLRLPTGTIWPFMVSQDWYDTNIEGKEELEAEMQMYKEDPEGFGENE